MNAPYDTLDSKPGAEFLSSFEDVKSFVLGPILQQQFAADLITGSLRLHVGLNQPSMPWGSGFENELSTVYVRSYPKGRIGLPLEQWETRIVIFRVLDLKSKRSKTTVIRMFLMTDVYPPTDQKPSELARDTYGPLGVPLIAPILFSKHRSIGQRNLMKFAHSSLGYHFVAPSIAIVSSDPLGSHSNKLIVSGSHDVAIASYLGIDIVVDRVRRPVERGTHQEWAAQQSSLLSRLTLSIPIMTEQTGMTDETFEDDEKDIAEGRIKKGGKAAMAADFLYGAKMLCDLSSASGLLDMMSLDLSTGALPDIFSDPTGVPLVLAILTRIAAYPGRFRMDAGTNNDIWSAREIARAFEECNRPIMIVASPTEWTGSEHNMFAIDIAANLALNNVRESIYSALKKTKRQKNSDAKLDSDVFNESMETLFHHATSLLIDVAAPTAPDTYTSYGNANKIMDSISVKRLEIAQGLGMGQVGHRGVTTLRCNHRSQRQAKLLSILQMVENWLKDGKVNGVQVCTTNQHNPRSKREKPIKAKQDAYGHVPVPSYSARLDVGAEFSDICLDALNAATHQLESLFQRGPALFFAGQCTDVVTFSKRSKLACANCPNQMDAVTAFALSTVDDNVCQTCARPRCQECLDMFPRPVNCLRCAGDN